MYEVKILMIAFIVFNSLRLIIRKFMRALWAFTIYFAGLDFLELLTDRASEKQSLMSSVESLLMNWCWCAE